jgi:hypothetical protein
VRLLKSGLIVATYFYSKVDMGLIMNGQISRSLLSFSIGIAVLGVTSAIPVSAQPTKLLTWQQRIDQQGGIHREITYDWDLPSEFRNGYVYTTQGANWVSVYVLKTGLSGYPSYKEGLNQISQDEGEGYVESGKAIKIFWNPSAHDRYGHDNDIRFPKASFLIPAGTVCFQITCFTAPSMNKMQIKEILFSIHKVGKEIKVEKPSKKVIQDLPDGNYFYGADSNPYKVGTDYLIFKKVDRILTGMQYLAGSGSNSCFTGTIQDDKIVNATEAYLSG